MEQHVTPLSAFACLARSEPATSQKAEPWNGLD
jgi:hypothetical protein